jgi:heat-inducible transcriptional repressor
VQIFIGADNPLFANTGCSMVVAPFRDSQERILGAIGVIGPTRLNYARIIPLVDYTARDWRWWVRVYALGRQRL